MTDYEETCTLATESIEDRPTIADRLLRPLADGKPVWLSVEDDRLPRKTRKYPATLVLVPTSAIGCNKSALLAALPPHGSELILVPEGLKAITFVRIGLRFSLAKALADALLRVYGERK